MTLEAWLAVTVIVCCVALLASNRHSADAILMGGVTLLLVGGILTPQQALGGLANEGMVTVGVLYVVVAGLQETGAVGWMADTVLGIPRSLVHAQWRLCLPILGISPFLNNTPVVAMFIPAIGHWAKRHQLPMSQLMLPLAFVTTGAGLCTLVGSSTNLVVHGLLRSKTGAPGFSLWELAWIGLPVTATILGYLLLFGRFRLPSRPASAESFANVREYTVEMMVEKGGTLEGKSVAEAHLRHLPGLFLVEIQRNGEVLPAVSSHQRLAGGDRLLFTGAVDSVADLRAMRGLVPATDQIFKLDAPARKRAMVEAVVAESCPIVGKSIRDGRFRTVYHAAILAVARNGHKLTGKVGDIVLRPGDQLLLEAHPDFPEQQRHTRDFLLVRSVDNYHPLCHQRAPLALGILLGFVGMATLSGLTALEAALLSAGLMLMTGCVNSATAHRAVEWRVLLVIAASFALGTALESTGAARAMATTLITLVEGNAWASLAAIYLVAALLTQVVTNNATAVLIFPIATATANDLGVSIMPFAVVVLVAASAAFLTPIGYQINLMVQGPGGYRFLDYFRFGWPLSLLVGAVTVGLAPLLWPF
ncbi:MAG: SLC13 family permease [Magnetococcales bacterium]|nr:SLC13 family permease [Magnetococcales bacterium]MBF0156223.1 SLC13 family permease [Magnetococcales bacterium]